LQTASDRLCSRLPAAEKRSYSSFYEDAINSRRSRTINRENRLDGGGRPWPG
jgi:hypothetical protein